MSLAWSRRAGWGLHALLRFVLILWMQTYIWSKLTITQMGQIDYFDALVTVGEKSPMGLLWIFMAYSPVVQFLAGLAELIAVLLIVFRRTAWLGGLLGTAAMGTVFVLNMTFDVPVKQPALALTIGFLLVAAPESRRLARFVAGRPTEGTEGVPRLLPWPKAQSLTRWVSPVLGLALIAASGVLFQLFLPAPYRTDLALAGVYRVIDDPRPPTAQLVNDQRWQSVAFGQWANSAPSVSLPGGPEPGSARVAIRAANGDLIVGSYVPVGEGVVRVDLQPLTSTPLSQPPTRTTELTWSVRPDGQVALSGAEQDLVLRNDPDMRFLFDRGFTWDLGDDAAVLR